MNMSTSTVLVIFIYMPKPRDAEHNSLVIIVVLSTILSQWLVLLTTGDPLEAANVRVVVYNENKAA